MLLLSKVTYGGRYAKVGDSCLVKLNEDTIVSAVVSRINQDGIAVIRSSVDTLISPEYEFCDIQNIFLDTYGSCTNPLSGEILKLMPPDHWCWNLFP